MKSFSNKILSIACLCNLLASVAKAQNKPNLSQTAPAGSVTIIGLPPNLTFVGEDSTIYVRKFTPLLPISDATTISEATPAEQVKMSTDYLNPDGSTLLTVQRNFTSNTLKNLVQARDARSLPGGGYNYLPHASASGYSVNPIADQKNFYNTKYPGEGYTSYTGTRNTSSSTERSSSNYSAGKSFVGQNKGKKTQLLSNSSTFSVKAWKLNASKKPTTSGVYPDKALSGAYCFDEEGRSSISFSDQDGREIEQIANVSGGGLARTSYVYDGLGRLRFIFPPKANEAIGSTTTVSDAILNSLCFQYQYDSLGRKSAVRNPSEGDFSYFVYDRKQRIIMKQTPNGKTASQWEVFFYDKWGRCIATSLYTSTQDRTYWQRQLDAPPGGLTASNLLYYLCTEVGEGVYPAETAVSGNTMMNYFYFDNYLKTVDSNGTIYTLWNSTQNFTPDLLDIPGAEIPVRSLRTHGMQTGTRSRIIRSPGAPASIGDWKHSVYYYDDKGRAIGIAEFDKLATEAQTIFRRAHYLSMQYSFTGKTILLKHTSNNVLATDGIPVHTEWVRCDYESSTNRLIKSSHRVDDAGWQVLNTNSYDELGRVKRLVYGNYGEVQDFTYNIRGQLNGINADYAETGNKGGESRSFGQSLKYDYGFTTNQFGGRIAGNVWRGNSGNMMAYGYAYDALGRMTKADFNKWEVNVTYPMGAWSNTWMDYSVPGLSYDNNGNILSMRQRGMGIKPGASAVSIVDMDSLRYVYETNSNRLSRVEDTVSINYNLGDFVNNNNGTADYTYDGNGNITKDLNKKISSITYNHLNKPQVVTFSNGDKIEYSYDASGAKLYEILNSATLGVKRFSYVGNTVYLNDTVQYINTPMGRTIIDQAEGQHKEEFFVQDHLGNIRSVVDVYTYPILTYLGTYEIASAGLESLYFDNHTAIAEENPESTSTEDMQSGRLNASEADRRVGTALLMRVMSGDKVELNVNTFYTGYSQQQDQPINASTMLSSIVSTLTTGTGGLGGSESHNPQMVGQVFNSNNYTQFESIVNGMTNPAKPKAYLNYILFNEQMQIVGSFSGAFQANGDGTWGTVGTTEPLVIPANGYLAVYINNKSTMNVFFDMVTIRFTRGQLKEEAHYYPHGLPMGNIGFAASGFIPNRDRYQGNANQTELGLNLMDFNFRQYDAQIGRFTAPDPMALMTPLHSPYMAMGNNPASYTDPNGLFFDYITLWIMWYNYLQVLYQVIDDPVIEGYRPKGKSSGSSPGGDGRLIPGIPGAGPRWEPVMPSGGGGSAGKGQQAPPPKAPGTPDKRSPIDIAPLPVRVLQKMGYKINIVPKVENAPPGSTTKLNIYEEHDDVSTGITGWKIGIAYVGRDLARYSQAEWIQSVTLSNQTEDSWQKAWVPFNDYNHYSEYKQPPFYFNSEGKARQFANTMDQNSGGKYFHDGPFQATSAAPYSFSAQLSLVGKRNGKWEEIITYYWGYFFSNGRAYGWPVMIGEPTEYQKSLINSANK